MYKTGSTKREELLEATLEIYNTENFPQLLHAELPWKIPTLNS